MPTALLARLLSKVLGNKQVESVSASVTESMIDYRFLAEHSQDTITLVGPDSRFRYVSPASQQIFGWLPEEMLGRAPEEFVLPEDLAMIQQVVRQLYSGEAEGARTTARSIRKDGSLVWVEVTARAKRDPSSGAVEGTVLVMRDVNERKRLEQELEALARQDGLTGLANRRAFNEALAQEWQRTVREGSQLSLLLLDVDHFKRFNDQYGHQVGDDCLRAVARAVNGAVHRPGDVAARYGGEELAVILPATDAAGALAIAEQARASVEALQLPHAGNPEGKGLVTISVGAATARANIGGTITMPEGLLTAADTALYKAKRSGRNQIETSLLLAKS
jgi:diguanylate cyclase (GGDEF)-like protein/PAS domain S-box-containing protein